MEGIKLMMLLMIYTISLQFASASRPGQLSNNMVVSRNKRLTVTFPEITEWYEMGEDFINDRADELGFDEKNLVRKIGGVIGGVVTSLAGLVFGWMTSTDDGDNTPPDITCPDIPDQTILLGQRSVVVVWADATAVDPESDIDSVQEVLGGRKSGESLEEGKYTLSYVAKNSVGLVSFCLTQFNVFSASGQSDCQCGNPVTPSRGTATCTAPTGTLPKCGESCTWSCEDGYELTGDSTQTCVDGEYSDGGTVQCHKKQCGEPQILDNMAIAGCTDEYNFESTCSVGCVEGHRLPTGIVNTIQCGIDQIWIGTLEPCKDAEPPVFDNCPETMAVNAERSEKYGIAYWNVPTASDTQGGPVQVTLTLGSPPGSQFSLEPNNVHTIAYSANDTEGNEAEQCEFQVIVQELVCPPYPYSERMNVTCYDDLVWGSYCLLECDRGYPLQGDNTVFCEKTAEGNDVNWNWTDGKPFCKVIHCPHLTPPENGALSCSGWGHGPYCQMQCNEKYDIPRTAQADNGEWVCDETDGTWSPDFPVPACSSQTRPGYMFLQNELFYFSGDCSDPATQEQIRQNFISQLSQSRFDSLCTEYEECTVDNVDVACGPVSGGLKKKKSTYTHKIRIDFEIKMAIQIPDGFTADDSESFLATVENKFNDMAALFAEDVVNGIMDLSVSGLDIETDVDSHQSGWIEMICKFGMIPEYSTFICASCPTGTKYDSDIDDCDLCPIGTYQDEDGQLGCKACPEYTSTRQKGATKLYQCIDICTYGHYSANGLADCAKCPVGTYEDTRGATDCSTCPLDTTTLSAGSTDIQLCLTNDEIQNLGICNRTYCNGGFCLVNVDSSLRCVCHGGYTGEFCEIPPDPCENHLCLHGGSCAATGTNYTCHCFDEYTGVYCQDKIVHGGYTEWTLWTHCSLTCGSGTKTRERECVNPPPGPGGRPCQGEAQETQTCNTRECPACSPITFGYGVTETCTDIGKDRVCEMKCRDGKMLFPDTLKPNVTCGFSTNYVWSYGIGDPVGVLSKCSTTQIGNRINFQSTLEYPGIDCDKVESIGTIESVVGENTNCSHISVCDTTVVKTCNAGTVTGRRKREAEIAVSDRNKRQVSHTGYVIQMQGLITNPDYFPSGIYDNTLATAAAEELETITAQIFHLVQALETALAGDALTITVDGQNYVPTVYIGANYECPAGMVPKYGVCVNCIPGTYQNDKHCLPCDFGTYQDNEGMAECKECPVGFTTADTGAETITECSVIDNTQNGGNDQHDSGNNGMNDNQNGDDIPSNSRPGNTNDNNPSETNLPSGDAGQAVDDEDREDRTTSGSVPDQERFDTAGNILWPVIGGVLGCIILLMALVFGIVYWRFKLKKSKQIQNYQNEAVTTNIQPNGGAPGDTTLRNTTPPPAYDTIVEYNKPKDDKTHDFPIASTFENKVFSATSERGSTAASTRKITCSISSRHNSSASLGKPLNDTCTMID